MFMLRNLCEKGLKTNVAVNTQRRTLLRTVSLPDSLYDEVHELENWCNHLGLSPPLQPNLAAGGDDDCIASWPHL